MQVVSKTGDDSICAARWRSILINQIGGKRTPHSKTGFCEATERGQRVVADYVTICTPWTDGWKEGGTDV